MLLPLILRFYELVDGERLEEMLALFHENAAYSRPGYPDLVGLEALRHYYAEARVIQAGGTRSR